MGVYVGAIYISGEIERRYQNGMGKTKVAILLLWVLLALCIRLQLTVEARASSPLERQIEAKLKQPTKVCN